MFIIARPKPNNEPADEYYEIACGAHNNPNFEFPRVLNNKIINTNPNLSKYTVSTMQFLIDEIGEELKKLKHYDQGESEYNMLTKLLKSIELIDQGNDPYKNKTGFRRQAYRSKLDGSLQPYVVYLPDNYDTNEQYPLFVFLHGSDMDEQSIVGAKRLIPEGFIGLGPFGRGTSNGYNVDNAQIDIAEAVNAVSEQFSVDDSKIILAGFSMGGYGVYRTYWETPGKYKALAVFSGGPNMGEMYSRGQPSPSFLDENNLKDFKNVPIFIHHGQKDLNAPFELTKELVNKLERVGAKVTFIADPVRGHEAPSLENRDKYYNWVKTQIK